MTSGKDTWTSPCRTKPHTATQAPDCKRKWGFGQLFLEQHDSALISWNNPFDWERLRSQFFQVWLSAPASQLWRSTITAGSKNHRMLIFHGKKITYIQETLPGCYSQVNRWYSAWGAESGDGSYLQNTQLSPLPSWHGANLSVDLSALAWNIHPLFQMWPFILQAPSTQIEKEGTMGGGQRYLLQQDNSKHYRYPQFHHCGLTQRST